MPLMILLLAIFCGHARADVMVNDKIISFVVTETPQLILAEDYARRTMAMQSQGTAAVIIQYDDCSSFGADGKDGKVLAAWGNISWALGETPANAICVKSEAGPQKITVDIGR
jgi:hypothetical protein